MDILSESSGLNEHNISLFFSTPSSINELNSISKKSKVQGEKKIFEIFHKKEIIINKESK